MKSIKDSQRRAALALLATMPDVRHEPPVIAASVILAEAFQTTTMAMVGQSDLSDADMTQALMAGLASTAGMFLSFAPADQFAEGAAYLARQTVLAAERHAQIRSRKDASNDR